MNCNHINKFICFKVNFKPFTTNSPAKLQHIFSGFQQNLNEQMKTVKFVPIVKVPKMSAGVFHDRAQQVRMLSLQSGPTSGIVGAKLATNRLQKLVQVGPSSLMNFSTKKIVKSRSIKSISKHKLGSIGSSSRSSFIGKSNNFLNKFILSNAESTQKRYRSTGSWGFMSAVRQNKENARIKTKQEERAGSSYSKSRRERIESTFESDREDISYRSKDIGEDAAGKLEEVSARIRDDLMKIDGSMKQRLISMRNKTTSGMVQSGRKEEPRVPSFGVNRDQEDSLHLNLMPMAEKKKDALASYLEEVNLESNREAIVGTLAKPSKIVQIRRNMVTVDQPGDGRGYGHQFIEPMTVRGKLMDPPSKVQRNDASGAPLQYDNASRDRHVLGIRLKDSADADGVYFIRRRRM